MKNLMASLIVAITFVACDGPEFHHTTYMRATFEKNHSPATYINGIVKISDSKYTYMREVHLDQYSMAFFPDVDNEFINSDSDINLQKLKITFKEVGTNEVVCPETIDYTKSSSGDSYDQYVVYNVRMHFNLSKPCQDPFAQTQKLLRKGLLKKIFGGESNDKKEAINNQGRVQKEQMSEQDDQKQRRSSKQVGV